LPKSPPTVQNWPLKGNISMIFFTISFLQGKQNARKRRELSLKVMIAAGQCRGSRLIGKQGFMQGVLYEVIFLFRYYPSKSDLSFIWVIFYF